MIVFVARIVDDRRSILLGLFRRFFACGHPCALGNPVMVQLARLRNGKNALRDARAKAFIHDAEIERHGNGSRMVGAGIVELAVQHDHDRDEARLALIGYLHQSERAGSLFGLFAPILLHQLRMQRNGLCGEADESNRTRQNTGEDDGAQAPAI